jgi:hypothetical protein
VMRGTVRCEAMTEPKREGEVVAAESDEGKKKKKFQFHNF